jgi:hypothetical protein
VLAAEGPPQRLSPPSQGAGGVLEHEGRNHSVESLAHALLQRQVTLHELARRSAAYGRRFWVCPTSFANWQQPDDDVRIEDLRVA